MIPTAIRDAGSAQVAWHRKIKGQVGEFRRGGVRGGVVQLPLRDEEHITTPMKHLIEYGKVRLMPDQDGPFWCLESDGHSASARGVKERTKSSADKGANRSTGEVVMDSPETAADAAANTSPAAADKPSVSQHHQATSSSSNYTSTLAKGSSLHQRVKLTNFSYSHQSPPAATPQATVATPVVHGCRASQPMAQEKQRNEPPKRARPLQDSSDDEACAQRTAAAACLGVLGCKSVHPELRLLCAVR